MYIYVYLNMHKIMNKLEAMNVRDSAGTHVKNWKEEREIIF